jgi:predicted aspartyl protease
LRHFLQTYIILIFLTTGIFLWLFVRFEGQNVSVTDSVSTPLYSIDKKDTATLVIPLKRIGKLYLIEANIDGVTGNLVFDTGASGLVLNETYFRHYVSFGEHNSSGITGSVVNNERITANSMTVGPLKYRKAGANMANLGHIENRRGVKVLGLFGFELMSQYEIQIDYAHNQLRLYPTDKKGELLNPSVHFKADYTQKIEENRNIMFIKGSIDGRLLRFCFDTGAETNVLSTDLPKSVLQTVSITRTSKLRGAGSSYTEVIYGRMNEFVFGDSTFTGMQTVITYLDHLNESYGTTINGMLGFDFISKGTFCINFVKKQMGIAYLKTEDQ